MKSHSALEQTHRSLESRALAVTGAGWTPSHRLQGRMGGGGSGRLSGKRMEEQSKTKSKIPTPLEMQNFHVKAFTF